MDQRPYEDPLPVHLAHLQNLESLPASEEFEWVSELFHRINRVIPADQIVITVSPQTRVKDAMRLMQQHGFSQVPVTEGGEVLGVFSYRSFGRAIAEFSLVELNRDKGDPGNLPVDEFLEQLDFAQVMDEMRSVFDSMDRDNAVLIGMRNRLQGILTPMDFLRYLYQVASPFVMLSEIELALRALIRLAVTGEVLITCIRNSLTQLYGEDRLPTTLEDLTFEDYKTLLTNTNNWPTFQSVFGSTRVRTAAKLKETGKIRNDLFHFRCSLSAEDREILANHRNWFLMKARQADARRKGAKI